MSTNTELPKKFILEKSNTSIKEDLNAIINLNPKNYIQENTTAQITDEENNVKIFTRFKITNPSKNHYSCYWILEKNKEQKIVATYSRIFSKKTIKKIFQNTATDINLKNNFIALQNFIKNKENPEDIREINFVLASLDMIFQNIKNQEFKKNWERKIKFSRNETSENYTVLVDTNNNKEILITTKKQNHAFKNYENFTHNIKIREKNFQILREDSPVFCLNAPKIQNYHELINFLKNPGHHINHIYKNLCLDDKTIKIIADQTKFF